MRTWNRNTIDLKEFRESNIAIHCDTEEKADDLLKYLNEQEIIWCSGEELKYNNYFCYKELTCYKLNHTGLSYSDIDWWKSNYYDIIEWKIIDENQQYHNIRKNNITWDAFMIEDIVIHCKTEKETEELLCWILQNKKEMLRSPISSFADGWYSYKGDVCFEFDLEDSMICYGDKKFYNNQHYKILEWSGKNLYEINGTIETDMDIDELNDKFIDFIESINCEFAGGIK